MNRRLRSAVACVLGVLFAATACGGGTSASASPSPSATPGCVNTNDAYAKAVLADNPVAYYRLSDAAGAKMCDASASRNDGTYNSHGVSYRQPGALKGIDDTAITADGTGNPATSDSISTVVGSTDFALEGWFKTTTKSDQIVVDIGQGGAGRIAGIGPSSKSGNSNCGGLSDAVGFDTFDGYITADATPVGINVFDGAWHYIVGSYTAASGTADIYLDGHLLKSVKINDQPATSPVRVGYWIDTFCNAPFAGSIDEVAVYHSALGQDRVKAHYAAAGR